MINVNAFLPPHEPVELPSKGKLYRNSSLSDGWVHIRQYCAAEEALLAQVNRENVQKVLNSILDNCIKGEDISSEELTSEDAFYLLVWLRVNSFGPSYDVDITCPFGDCGVGPESYVINLSDLTVNYLEGDVEEPFTITLPKTKLKVEINCMRRKTEVSAQTRQKDVKKWRGYKGDPTDLLKRAYSISRILTPDGQETEDRLVIEDLCLNVLPSADSVFIDEKLKYYKHGVDIDTKVSCHHCQRDIPISVPPGPEFFRPTRLSFEDAGELSVGTPDSE